MVSTPLKQSVPGVKLDSEPENDVLANCHFSERVMIDCFIHETSLEVPFYITVNRNESSQ